jgi:hypothetical protein
MSVNIARVVPVYDSVLDRERSSPFSFTIWVWPGRDDSRVQAHKDIPHLVVIWKTRNGIVDSIHAYVPDLYRSRWEALLSRFRPLPIGCDKQIVPLLFSVGKLNQDRVFVVGDDILDRGVEQVMDARLVFSGLVEYGRSEGDTISKLLTISEYRPKVRNAEHRPLSSMRLVIRCRMIVVPGCYAEV